MDKSKTIHVKGADGIEVAYIASSRGLTLEVEDLRLKTTLDSKGTFEKFLLGHAQIENHKISLLDRPTIKVTRVVLQIRERHFAETDSNNEEKSCAGELQVIHTDEDHEFDCADEWTFILYISRDAFESLLELIESKKLNRLFTHVTPNFYEIEGAGRFSDINMPHDFFAQNGITYGDVNWISTDGESIDLRAYSDNWTEEEKIAAGLTTEPVYLKKLSEMTRYIKWIALGLVALTVITLLKS